MLIFVFRTSASDCLEDRLQSDLCVERDVKPYSLTQSLTVMPNWQGTLCVS